LHPKTWKNRPQKLLIIGPNSFFQYCQPTQNQPKSQFLFHKNFSPHDLCIMTLILRRVLINVSSFFFVWSSIESDISVLEFIYIWFSDFWFRIYIFFWFFLFLVTDLSDSELNLFSSVYRKIGLLYFVLYLEISSLWHGPWNFDLKNSQNC